MKTITYKETEYNVPENFSEITLEMQIKAEKLIKELGDELKLIGLISAYTEIPISLIKEGNVAVINEIHETLAFIYDGYVPEVINSFEHEGHTYYLKELQDTQFQDFLSLQIVLESNKETPINGLPRMIAIMCKRENETLDDYDLDEREKELINLPLSTAKNVEGFFLSKSQELRIISLLSTKEFREEFLSIKLESLRNTIKEWKVRNGNSLRMKLASGVYLLTLKYLEKTLTKSFNTQHSKKSMKSIWKTFRKRNQNMKEKSIKGD